MPEKSIWVRLWASRTAWAGTFALVGAFAAFVLTQGVDSLRNARVLPSEAKETYYSFLSWYYDDKKWTGTWSSRDEGHIDDYKLAELPIELNLQTERGKVSGEMFNRSVCELNPMLPPVLVEGEVRGKRLVAYAYAFVQGQRNFIYSFSVDQESDELVATVRPLRDPLGLLPSDARLVRRIETHDAVSKPGAVAMSHPDLQCPESPMQYIERLRKEKSLPSVEQLGVGRAQQKNAPK